MYENSAQKAQRKYDLEVRLRRVCNLCACPLDKERVRSRVRRKRPNMELSKVGVTSFSVSRKEELGVVNRFHALPVLQHCRLHNCIIRNLTKGEG